MKSYLIAAVIAVIAVTGAYLVIEPVTYTAPAAIVAPLCEIECLIARRTEDILVRDAHIYREQARLNAMLEINAELQTLVYPE